MFVINPVEDITQSYKEFLNGVKIEQLAIDLSNPSYLVVIRAIDWDSANFARGIQFPLSDAPALIKYSASEFSPVSPTPSKHIRLATPSVFRSLNPDENSELIADKLDSALVEQLDWNREGTTPTEFLKKSLRESQFDFEQANAHITLTLSGADRWMYCASIAPENNRKRKKQRENLSTNYDFMTRIDNPSNFAKQLGYDFGKQVKIKADFQCNSSALFEIGSAAVKEHIANSLARFATTQELSTVAKSVAAEALARHKEGPDGYSIFIDHGPVLYLESKNIAPFIAGIPKFREGEFLPFVKQIEYEEQKEYRFVTSIQFHTPKNDAFNLIVSDELRNLMTPLGFV